MYGLVIMTTDRCTKEFYNICTSADQLKICGKLFDLN